MSFRLLAEHLGSPCCVGCARPGGLVCARCHEAQRPATVLRVPPHLDRVMAAWDYDGVARALVLDLKLKGKRAAALELAKGLVERVWEQGSAAHALVWVPGRRRDIRARGFDHARLIAMAVGDAVGLPVIDGLRRTGDRVDQTSLGARARRTNLHGAFVATGVPARIAVVDDLMTTGATLSEAGRALRQAGARRVEGLLACSVA